MNPYFVILSHNEPEIFRLLDQLMGQEIVVIDDFSEMNHFQRLVDYRPSLILLRRALSHDFSSQRNFANEYVPRDEWSITIDADELFTNLHGLLAELPTIKTEAIRMHRHNEMIHKDGSRTTSDEHHIRAFRNYPDRIKWHGKLHENVVGFKSETQLKSSSIIHIKTEERCIAQHLFYEEVKKDIAKTCKLG